MKRVLFILAQCTWALPQTMLGFLIFLWVRARGMAMGRPAVYHGAAVTAWPQNAGLSLGLFVFVPAGCPPRLLAHEYGHCLQSLVLGPLYLPVVALPSALWFNLPVCKRYRAQNKVDYYTFYTERWADAWSRRFLPQ